MRKTLVCAFLFLVVAAAAWSGETLRVLGVNHPWAEGIKAMIPAFEKETGIKVQFEQYGEDQLMQKLTVEFTAGGDGIDVIMTRPQNDLRLFLRNGWITDLGPFFKDDASYDFADFTAGSVEATRINGVQAAIPGVSELEVLYYRRDLLEAKGLKVPTTFEELEAAAKILDDKENDMCGFLTRGARSPLVTQFANYLYGFGGDFYNDTLTTSRIDDEAFLAATEYYANLVRKFGPPGILNMSWPQCYAVFAQGKAAMLTEASSGYANLLDPAKSLVADRTEVAPFPSGPKGHKFFEVTAWALSMPAKTQKSDAAWKFIRFMTSKESTVVIQGKFLNQCARKSTYADPEGTKNFPASWVKTVSACAGLGISHDRPLISSVAEARDVIGQIVVDAIEGKDYKATAKQASAKFQALLDKEKVGK